MLKSYFTKKERQILDILEQVGICGDNTCHVYISEEFFIDRIGEMLPILYDAAGTETLTSCLGHLMNHPNLIIWQIEKQTEIIVNFKPY